MRLGGTMNFLDSPKITIAIPTYDRPSFLRQSVASATGQTYKNIEIIVSDNCSPGGIPLDVENICDDRLRLIRQPRNIGQSGNWDFCVEAATGDFFLMLSDDDILKPNALELLIAPYLTDGSKEYGISYGRSQIIDEVGNLLRLSRSGRRIEPAIDLIVKFWNGKRENYPCSIMVRTDDLLEAGKYNGERYGVAMDAAAWMNILTHRKMAHFVPEVVAEYRIHPNNLTSTTAFKDWMHGLEVMTMDVQSKINRDRASWSKYKIECARNRFLTRMAVRFAFSRIFKPITLREAKPLILSLFFYAKTLSSLFEICKMMIKGAGHLLVIGLKK